MPKIIPLKGVKRRVTLGRPLVLSDPREQAAWHDANNQFAADFLTAPSPKTKTVRQLVRNTR
jgi:hypothetical protein